MTDEHDTYKSRIEDDLIERAETRSKVQRYSYKALMDFSNAKAKKLCHSCKLVFLAEETVCPKCKSEGEIFVDGRFL